MKTLLAILILAMPLYAGNEHGSGGDAFPVETGSAWFLGKEKLVKTCYVVSHDFGPSPQKIREAIEGGFGKWKDYFENNVTGYFSEKAAKPAMNLTLMESCDGSEDLKFFLGVSTPETETAKVKYSDPVAFAERTQYDLDAGWGKGYVWISPPEAEPLIDWTLSTAFQGIVLHELGHVFGCSHVEGTIMTENIAHRLYVGKLLTKIDGYKQLTIPRWGNTLTSKGRMGPLADDPGYLSSFKLLTGKDAKGGIINTLSIGDHKNSLKFKDSESEFELPLKLPDIPEQSFQSTDYVFKSVRNITKTGKKIVAVPGGSGRIIHGTIVSKDGHEYAIVILRNVGNDEAPVTIQLAGNGNYIFYANVQ